MHQQKRRRRSENEIHHPQNSRRRMMSLNKLNDFKKSRLHIILLIEALCTVLLFAFFGIGAFLIASIAFLYSFLVYRANKREKKPPFFSRIVALGYLFIIIGGGMLFGVLDNLIAQTTTSEFYVITLKTNEVDKVAEIPTGETIGLSNQDNYQTFSFPKTKFAEEGYDFDYAVYNNEEEAVSNLIAGVEDYVVVENPKASNLKAIDGYSDTKVIGHYKEKVKINKNNKNVTREPFTVLITGVDTRDNSIDENGRSDSIMVAKVDPKNKTVDLVSLPRDSYVDSTCTGGKDKLTHSSLGSMNCIIDDVEQLLDVEIDYYVKVNFYAVIEAIDAVGGIDVDVESSFCGQDENDNLNAYCFDAGPTHMNGAEALSYARERKSFSDGDYARTRHQQQVIDGFVDSLVNSNPLVLSNLLSIASESARTNLSPKQLTSLGLLFQGSKDFVINSYTVTGYSQSANIPYWGLYGTSVQVLDEESLAEAKSILNE